MLHVYYLTSIVIGIALTNSLVIGKNMLLKEDVDESSSMSLILTTCDESKLTEIFGDAQLEVITFNEDFAVIFTDLDEDSLNNLNSIDNSCDIYVETDSSIITTAVQADAPFGLDRIDQRKLPLDDQFNNAGLTGLNRSIYVLDTGIDLNHSEFQSNRASFGYNAFDSSFTGDDNGHGTAVASLIIGNINGVAKQSNVVSVKILNNQGEGSLSTLIKGLQWLNDDLNEKQLVIPIVLLSFSSPSSDSAIVNSILGYMKNRQNILFISGAGNDNKDACSFTPASSIDVLSVASTDDRDNESSFSNYGECVTLYSPGEDVSVADFKSTAEFTTMEGTSMAAAYVAGVSVLYVEAALENPAAVIGPSSVSSRIQCDATPDVVDLSLFSSDTRSDRLLYLRPDLKAVLLEEPLKQFSCDIPCPDNCNSNGNNKNNGYCTPIGRCSCNPGFVGQFCKDKAKGMESISLVINDTVSVSGTTVGMSDNIGNSSPEMIYNITAPSVGSDGEATGFLVFTASLCSNETNFDTNLRLYDEFWTDITPGKDTSVVCENAQSGISAPATLTTLLQPDATYFLIVEGDGSLFGDTGKYGLTMVSSIIIHQSLEPQRSRDCRPPYWDCESKCTADSCESCMECRAWWGACGSGRLFCNSLSPWTPACDPECRTAAGPHCTGEACDECDQCRSASGECGTGFLYCNRGSTWVGLCDRERCLSKPSSTTTATTTTTTTTTTTADPTTSTPTSTITVATTSGGN